MSGFSDMGDHEPHRAVLDYRKVFPKKLKVGCPMSGFSDMGDHEPHQTVFDYRKVFPKKPKAES